MNRCERSRAFSLMEGEPTHVVYRLGTQPENSGRPGVGVHLYWLTVAISGSRPYADHAAGF
jgi:hypothetical protein